MQWENASFLPWALQGVGRRGVTLTLPPPGREAGMGVPGGELKMLSLLLVDLMNGLWDLKAPSALAGNLPAFPGHLLDKCIGQLWVLCLPFFLLENCVPSPSRVLITQ